MAAKPRFVTDDIDDELPAAAPAEKFDSEDIRQSFAKELWKRSTAKGWSQSDLARHAGLGRDAVNRWWNAKILPSDRSLQKLARALGCDPEELLPASFTPSSKKAAPLELRVNPHNPARAWLKLETELSFMTAAKIIELVQIDREKDA